MDFPSLLSDRLHALNITQQDLADRIGVDRSAISKWSAARQFPRQSMWQSIADALGEGVTRAVIAETIANTTKVGAPTTTQRLKEAESRVVLLERENSELRAKLRRLERPQASR